MNEAWQIPLTNAVLTALHDHVGRAFIAPRLQALGVLAPGRNRMRITLTRLAFTTTVRVIDRVHGLTAHGRPDAQPTLRAGLAVHLEVVFVVRHFADGGAAVDVHLAALARLQAQQRVDAFARGERGGRAGTAHHLAALAGLELDVVHDRADRDVTQLHGVARLDRRVRARAHFVAGLHALGREDVAALAVEVLDQRDVAGAVRIVLDALDHALDAVLVATEIDDAVLVRLPTALVARGDASDVVAAGLCLLGLGERRERAALVQVRLVELDAEARARRSRFHLDDWHV